MKTKKKQKAFDFMQLLTDEKGHEYLSYTSSFGPVKDYSPRTIREYKEYKNID